MPCGFAVDLSYVAELAIQVLQSLASPQVYVRVMADTESTAMTSNATSYLLLLPPLLQVTASSRQSVYTTTQTMWRFPSALCSQVNPAISVYS
jgi:hypothetical protein